jgi:hypothetical protein
MYFLEAHIKDATPDFLSKISMNARAQIRPLEKVFILLANLCD